MTSPSAPIDADLSPFSNDVYYVLEESGVWKTTNLTAAGASTWEQVWSSGDFEGSEFGGLLRIKCAYRENLVYVLGWGYDEASVSKAFVLKSQDAGGSWVQNWIEEEIEVRDYTVTYVPWREEWEAEQSDFDTDYIIHERIGDDEVEVNPVAIAVSQEYWTADGDDVGVGIRYGQPNHILVGGESAHLRPIPSGVCNSLLGSGCQWGLGEAVLNDFFGVKNTGWYYHPVSDCNMPKEAARNALSFHVDILSWAPQPAGWVIIHTWVFWNVPSPNMPKAIDCARSNPDWVYVGLIDKVMKSEDGSETWEELITDHGAYDICVDPQAAGAIYYWDTNGELRLNVAGVDQGSLLSDSAHDQHGRLARDINSGRLWACDASGNVKMRNLGSWTTQYTGNMPMGIKSYIDGNLIFLGSDSIQLSSDYGETWSDKTGDWAEYGSPKAANLMDDNL